MAATSSIANRLPKEQKAEEVEASDPLDRAARELEGLFTDIQASCRAKWTLEAKRLQEEQRAQEMEHLLRQHEQDAQALAAFLQEHQYAGVNARRQRLLQFKYPLHSAVKLGDTKTIRLLLQAGADPALRNSLSETPQELAARLHSGDEGLRRGIQAALATGRAVTRPAPLTRPAGQCQDAPTEVYRREKRSAVASALHGLSVFSQELLTWG